MAARRTQTIDEVVGRVVEFVDEWRGRKATCLLLGEGPGPEGESVRLVGFPREVGFTLAYVRSYDEGRGNGRAAYGYLRRRYGDPLTGIEVVSEAGRGFNARMLDEGHVASWSEDGEGPKVRARR